MNLGLNFAGNDLLFAVSAGGHVDSVHHIGRISLAVDTRRAVRNPSSSAMGVVQSSVKDLITKFGIQRIRIVVSPDLESWVTVPKLVYDHVDEREAYLSVLYHGEERAELVPTWHDMCNRDYKLMSIRRKPVLAAYRAIGELAPEYDLCSEFEAGMQWISRLSSPGGVLMIGSHNQLLTIASYTFGGLRAATWLRYDDPSDLRYMWPHMAESAKWMSGIHDRVVLFGSQAWHHSELLKGFHDPAIPISRLDSLHLIGVAAEEKTYGFGLDEAFPAIMMAIN